MDREALILSALPVAKRVAWDVAVTAPGHIDFDDLYQIACLSLVDLAASFDESRGVPFGAWAAIKLRYGLIDTLRRQSWPRAIRAAMAEDRVTPDQARRLAVLRRLSRISPERDEDRGEVAAAGELVDLGGLVGVPAVAPDEAYAAVERRARVAGLLAGLKPRERRVVLDYYYRGLTMKAIGVRLGVNESRISQILAAAMRKLRAAVGCDPLLKGIYL